MYFFEIRLILSKVRKFLVCDTEKEKSCRVASLVSLYGTGKTYCMYYLAHQCGLYVIPVHSLLSPLKVSRTASCSDYHYHRK